MNGVKAIADIALLPGSSQIVQGQVGTGILYGLAGVAAKSLLGPVGWLAAGLDAYSMSSSGRHLWQLMSPPRPKSPTSDFLKPE